MRRAWGYLVGSSSSSKNDDKDYLEDDDETSFEEHETDLKIIDEEEEEEDDEAEAEVIPTNENGEGHHGVDDSHQQREDEVIPNGEQTVVDNAIDDDQVETKVGDPNDQAVEAKDKAESTVTGEKQKGNESTETTKLTLNDKKEELKDLDEDPESPASIQELDSDENQAEISDKKQVETEVDPDNTVDETKQTDQSDDPTEENKVIEEDKVEVGFLSDSDEEEWDEDDPFGFEADRGQEALLEAFRISVDEDEDKDQREQKGLINNSREVDPSFDRISNDRYTSRDDDDSVMSEEVHPNQALFDILERNFDDLDAFHVPSLNRLITAEEIKLFFVAFVVVFTPPKPFEFARKYNQDISIEEIVTVDFDQESSSKPKRRRWLFRRIRSDADFEAKMESTEIENDEECEKKHSKKSDDDEHTVVQVPHEAVLALWGEVAKGLGVIKNMDSEVESMKLIMNHVEEALLEMGMLEIETYKNRSISLPNDDVDGHELPVVSFDSNQSNDATTETKFYMIRHAINEQYGLFLAKYENSDVHERVSKLKKNWFEAVALVHNDISTGIDEYQMLMLPHLCIKGNQLSLAKDIMLNDAFMGKRFETMGLLLCATIQLTDIDTMAKSKEASDGFISKLEDFIGKNLSLLRSKLEGGIEDAQQDDGKHSASSRKINAVVEAGKAFHLIALLLGSLGYVTKELEYHAEAIKCKEYWVQSTDDNAIASLSLSDSYNCMGVAYDNIGDFEEAITCYDRALTTRRSLLGNNHLKVAETCHSMGSLLCEQHELDSACLLLEEALRIRKYHLSERDGSVAETEQWLGNLMRESGRLDEALAYFKSALISKKAKVGNDHEDVADAMHNMAIILDDLEKYDLSITCYQEALRIRELAYGHENLMVADTLLCLGTAYKAMNKNHKAISHFKDSIDIRKKLLPPYDELNDSSLIVCMDDLSDDLLGQHKGLIDCYMEIHPLVEAINKKNEENGNTDVGITSTECLQQMGNIYAAMRCWDDAHERYETALAMCEEFDPELVLKIGLTCVRRGEFEIGKESLYNAVQAIKSHPKNTSILHHSLVYTLGVTHYNLEHYEDAISSFNECLSILENCSRPIDEGNTHHWIGRCYYERQDYTTATKSVLTSLKIFNENRMDVKEQMIYRTLHLLGNTHFKNKQIKLALKCYEEEISLFKHSSIDLSPNDDCLSEAHYCAGIIYAKRGSFDDASAHLETALETRKRFQGEENKKIAKILHKLGKIYLEKKENESAKEKLFEAYLILCKIQGPNDEYTAAVQFKLGQALDSLNELDTAMGHYKQCLESRESLKDRQDEEVAIVLFFMGKNASLRLQYDESIDYLEKALDIRRKVHSMDHDLIATVLYELGKSYHCQKIVDKSLLCYREALRIWKLSSDESNASLASFAIAEIFERDNKINLAIKNYSECITLTSNSDCSRMYTLHCRLGNLYEQKDDLDKAVYFFEKNREDIDPGNIDDSKLVDTLRSLSNIYSKMKRYDDALECNKDLVSLQSDSSSLADVFHSMGNTYFALGQNDEALEYLNKSLSIHKTTREPDMMSVAAALVNLAKVNESMKDLEEAYDNLVEALRIFKLKRQTNFTIEALDTLANINQSMEKMDEAKECFEESISLKTEFYGDQHLSLALSLHEFGSLHLKLDNFSVSLEVLKSALKIRKHELGLNHEETTATIIKIGEVYFRQEEYAASLSCFEQVLSILKTFDNNGNSAKILFVCNSFIGTIHHKEGRFDSAVVSLKEAVQCKECNTSIGIAFHDTLQYLGSALQITNRHGEAIEYLQLAAEKRLDEFGSNSKNYAESKAALGECYYCTYKYKEAMAQLSEVLDVLKCMKCTTDVLYARTQICIAKILMTGERYKDAMVLFDTSIELYEDAPGNHVKEIADVYLLKGKIYAKEKEEFNKAIDQFKKCLELRKKLSGGTETESVAEVLMEVGMVLADKNELISSLNFFIEALKIRKMIHKEGRLVASAAHKTGITLQRLRRFNEALDSFEDARTNYTKSDENYQVYIGKLDFCVGLVHKECNRPDEALKAFRSAIDSLQEQDDEDCVAQCHYHLALLLSDKHDDAQSSKSLLEALELLRGNNERNKVKIADVLTRLAKLHEKKSEDRDALSLYLEASQIYEGKSRQRDYGYCLLQIGNLYMKSDRLDKSYPVYKKALVIHKQHPFDEKDLASILYGLGFIYNQRSQHDEAMGVLKTSLKLRLRLLGKTSLEVAKTCEQLGTALVSLSRYEDALKVCTTALDIYRNELGENHICCARVMLDIGTIYCNKENYDLSLVQLQACLQFFKKECGDASEEVANVLLRIGQIHDLRVDNDEAMKCMTEALEIRTQMYGRNDVRVAETMLNIARVLQDWGDVDEAMDCFQNALKIYQLSKEDRQAAAVYNEIGSMYSEQSEHEKALDAYNKALDIFKEKVGKNSTEVGNTLRNIGAVYDSLNDISRSYKFYSDSLKILSHNLGKEDLGVSLVLNNLGINLARRNEFSKAFEFCKEALLIRRKLLPDGHLDIADTLFNIANILDDKGDQDEQALKFYIEALAKYKMNFGDDNEDVANCNKNIGLIYMRRGESVNALKKISEALRIFRLKHGDNNSEVASLLYNLGRLFGKQAKYDRALSCFNECLKIRSDILGIEHEDTMATKRFVVAIQRKMNGGR